jgi:hypothetical protein
MQHARSTLRKIFTDTLRREGSDAPLLGWALACGAKTAERTTAIAFADGVLTVSVPDNAWRQQLQSLAPRYLAALNQITSEPVSRINFVTTHQPER